ncbi:MAG: phosphoribosyltransferase [Chloroflexota bacterium]
MESASNEVKSNLWLARALFDLGGVQFGSFTLGRSTVNSPVYINPRVLVSQPRYLKAVAELIRQETSFGQARRRPRIAPFDLVAGVPFGGLHLATAFSLLTETPMIYVRPGGEKDHRIEGRYQEGQTVLVIDDLITTGGSIVETASILEAHGLKVRDVIVLVDREQGATERLRRRGYNLVPILRLTVMLNYYYNTGLIDEFWYRRSLEYLRSHQTGPEE